jgi:hypothetical protein
VIDRVVFVADDLAEAGWATLPANVSESDSAPTRAVLRRGRMERVIEPPIRSSP